MGDLVVLIEDYGSQDRRISGFNIRRNSGEMVRRRDVLWAIIGGWVGFRNLGGVPCWVEV